MSDVNSLVIKNPQTLSKTKEDLKTITTQKFSEDEMWAKSRLGSLTEEQLNNILSFNETEEEVNINNLGKIEQIEAFGQSSIAFIEDYKSDEAREIKASKQFHLPSFRASLLKSTLVNSLELTDKKREELLNDSKTDLDDIVSRFVSSEEKNRIAKEAKAHLSQFWKLRTALADDPVLNTEQKARMLYNFAKAHASDVAVFHSLYEKGSLTKKREEHLEEYINGLEGLLEYFDKYDKGQPADGLLLTHLGLRTGSAHQRMFEGEVNVLKKAEARAKKVDEHVGKKEMVADLLNEKESKQISIRAEMDSSLSAEQKKGVNMMDSWLIEKGLNSTKRLPFINSVMALSARERLFVYHLIENNHLESPTMQDITLSQSAYVPDVTKISWKMYRIPYRLWEKAGHEGLVKHHWEKLEAAMQIVKQPDVVSAIQKCADASKTEKKIKGKLDENDPEYEDYKKISELTADRDSKLDDLLQKLSECEEASRKAESAWVYKSKKQALAKEKLTAAHKAINEFEAANKELLKKLSEKNITDSREVRDDISKNKDKKEITSGYEAESDLKENAMLLSGLALEAISQFKEVSTLSGIHDLIEAISTIKETREALKSGDIEKADALLMRAQAAYGLTDAVAGTLTGIKNIKDFVVGAKDVGDAVTSTVKKASVIHSATGLALDGADALMQGAHFIHHIKSDIKVSELNLKGNDKTYMEGLSKLELNNKTRKIVGTAFSAVSNAGDMASLFLGPAGAMAWSGISLGLSMTSKLADYLMKDATMKKSAEDFFNLVNISDLLVDDQKGDEIKEAYKKRALRDLKESETAQKELKESLLLHMAAKLGFTSYKSLFQHIVTKYSEFLHYNLFYHDGDKVIVDSEKEKYKMSVACAEMVRSMGLKVEFPTSFVEKTAMRQRHPSLKMIASKLGA